MKVKKQPVKKLVKRRKRKRSIVVPKNNDNTKLTQRQILFCREYIFDWNGTRSYKVAYKGVKSDDVAGAAASRLLGNVKIQSYIAEIQKDLEKIAGISRLKIINEHMKLAFNSIAHLHNTWIERKEFDNLTEDQKSCIAEISTQVRNINTIIEGNEDEQNVEKKVTTVEYVKIKLYDKQKALDSITKMLGYDAVSKMELTGKDGKELIPPARVLTKEEAKEFLSSIENGC